MRTEAWMLGVAMLAAMLMISGCDRRDASGSQGVGATANARTGSPVENSADNRAAPAVERDDAAITARVAQSIQADAALKSMPIKIDTKDGTVMLSGSVDTVDMRVHAQEIASMTPGVAGVLNNLDVKSAG